MNKQKQSGWKQPQPSLLALFLPSNFPSAGWLSGRGAWSCIPATDGRPCQGENNLSQHAPPTCRSHAPPIPGIRRRISQLERVRNHLLPAHPTRRGLCLDGSVWVLDESLEDGALSAAGVRGNEGSRSDQLFFFNLLQGLYWSDFCCSLSWKTLAAEHPAEIRLHGAESGTACVCRPDRNDRLNE